MTDYAKELETLDADHETELARVQVEASKSTGPYELQLGFPIQSAGAEVSKLTFRPMRIKDMREAGEPGTDAWMLKLIASLTEIPSRDLENLDPGDYEACGAVVLGFRKRRAAR